MSNGEQSFKIINMCKIGNSVITNKSAENLVTTYIQNLK